MASLLETTINDVGFLQVPIGNNSNRPSSPETAMIRWNTDIPGFEFYNGTEWLSIQVF